MDGSLDDLRQLRSWRGALSSMSQEFFLTRIWIPRELPSSKIRMSSQPTKSTLWSRLWSQYRLFVLVPKSQRVLIQTSGHACENGCIFSTHPWNASAPWGSHKNFVSLSYSFPDSSRRAAMIDLICSTLRLGFVVARAGMLYFQSGAHETPQIHCRFILNDCQFSNHQIMED